MNKETQQLITKYYIQKKWVILTKWILLSKHNIDVTEEDIRNYIKELNAQWIVVWKTTTKDLERMDWWLKEIVKATEQRNYEYNPETWHVIINIEGIQYPLLVTTLDAIIESFSRKWKDWSSQKVKYEFWLTDQVWIKIKNMFKIYKDTVPFSIVTMLEIPEGKFEEVAKEKAEQLVESKMNRIYTDTEQRLKERLFRDFSKASMWFDVFLDRFINVMGDYKRTELVTKQPKIKNNDTTTCFITDAHLWKLWTQWVINRFNEITKSLLQKEEKNITILFWDDIAELLVPYGEMHVGQRLWMEDITTPELVMLCVDVLDNMLGSLYNAWKNVVFKTVLGNHSRMTDNKLLDPFRSWGRIIYNFLKKLYIDKIDIEIFEDNYNIFYSGNIKYLVMHWDWLSPAMLNRLALQETEDWKYLCIINWDKHHLAFKDISENVMWIQAPALAWQWRYDKSLALTSVPWYLEMKENQYWLLDIKIHRLK